MLQIQNHHFCLKFRKGTWHRKLRGKGLKSLLITTYLLKCSLSLFIRFSEAVNSFSAFAISRWYSWILRWASFLISFSERFKSPRNICCFDSCTSYNYQTNSKLWYRLAKKGDETDLTCSSIRQNESTEILNVPPSFSKMSIKERYFVTEVAYAPRAATLSFRIVSSIFNALIFFWASSFIRSKLNCSYVGRHSNSSSNSFCY